MDDTDRKPMNSQGTRSVPFHSSLRAFLADSRLGSVSSQGWHDLALQTISSCQSEPEHLITSALLALKNNRSLVDSEHLSDATRRAAVELEKLSNNCGAILHGLRELFDLPDTSARAQKRVRSPDRPTLTPTLSEKQRKSKRVRHDDMVSQVRAKEPFCKRRPVYGFHLLKTLGIPCNGDSCLGIQDVIVAGAELAVICNFQIDMVWMWSQAPALQTFEKVIIVHGSSEAEEREWSQFLNVEGLSSDRVRFVRPALPSYGTMHSKMFLLFYGTGCRVCIHTANMVEGDWDYKTQAAYMRDFPTRHDEPSSLRSAPQCTFGDDLREYMVRCLKTEERRIVVAALNRYDFSSAGVALVSSVPGVHIGEDRLRFGHARLRTLLKEHVDAGPAKNSVAVCQFSSLGSTQEKWLVEEFGSTLFAQRGSPSSSTMCDRGEIKLVYPTVAQVEASNEGIQAGASIPVRESNLQRPHVLSRLHLWDGDASGRERAMPHIKTFLRYSTSSPNKLDWVFVGSFNLSVAAWGRMQGARKQKNKPWDRLNILSYEIGVLLSPRLWCPPVFALPDAVVKYAPSTPEEHRAWLEAQSWRHLCLKVSTFDDVGDTAVQQVVSDAENQVVLIPLPYSIPPNRYRSMDIPWTVDRCSMV